MKTFKKIEYCCEAEIYLAKKTTKKRPLLKWKRVYDTQDDISYIIEFDKKEYSSGVKFENENTAYWEPPFDLIENKVYLWRVKSFDGYEYSDYSKNQYIQYTINDTSYLMSFIDVNTKNVKKTEESIESQINVFRTVFNSSIKSEIYVDKVKKFQPVEIFVSLSPQTYLSSELNVKKTNYDYLESNIYIKTKRLLPPKAPLLVEMQSEFDFVTGNTKPILSWWKSLDELFCDDISYEIQIDTNAFFFEPLFFTAKNIRNPISEQMVYPMPFEMNNGKYYWRVRSTDGINYSEWSYGTSFEIDYSTEHLCSKINVVKKLIRSEINSEIEVYPKKFLDSELTVFGIGDSFLPSITTVWGKVNEFINSGIYVYIGNTVEFLMSEIFVEYKYRGESKLNSKLYIYPVKGFPNENAKAEEEIISNIFVFYSGNEILCSKINVMKHNDSSIKCKLNVCNKKSIEQISSELNVLKHKEEYIESYLYINNRIELTERRLSEIFVYNKEFYDLEAVLQVNSVKLNEIKVYSNKNQTDWFNDNEVDFWWEISKENERIVKGYIMQFNQIPDYDPQLGKDYYIHEGGDKIFRAKIFDISGEYYFHIQSFDKYYRTSPVTHYKVLYNNKPSIPENLKINGKILDSKNKFVSKNEKNLFSWDFSYDLDQNDWRNIKYELQICNKPLFEVPDFNSELIEDNFIELSFEEFLFSGTYYFRVRSFDGKEYSDWSKISSFIINNAPSIPTDISFSKKK